MTRNERNARQVALSMKREPAMKRIVTALGAGTGLLLAGCVGSGAYDNNGGAYYGGGYDRAPSSSRVSAPALAPWERIGSVEFSGRNDRETQYGNFGGSVEALALEARDSDVMCRAVTATFRNRSDTTGFPRVTAKRSRCGD